jgi:hypothetical protein
MEYARFVYQQANRCYQLAWQCFDLRVAHKLNLLANEHKATARELASRERNRRPSEELVNPKIIEKSQPVILDDGSLKEEPRPTREGAGSHSSSLQSGVCFWGHATARW